MDLDIVTKTFKIIFSGSVKYSADNTYDSIKILSGQTKPSYEEFKDVYDRVVNFIVPFEQLRAKRNKLLMDTDWTQTIDVTLENDEEWIKYRQALRDLPAQVEDPKNFTWPEPPAIKQEHVENIRTRLDATINVLEEYNLENTQIRAQLGDTQTQLQTTRTHLEGELQSTRTDLTETRTELQTTQTQLGDLQTQLQTTQTQLGGDLQSAHNQLQNTRTELEITNLKLHNAEARIGTLEQTMTSILSKLNV